MSYGLHEAYRLASILTLTHSLLWPPLDIPFHSMGQMAMRDGTRSLRLQREGVFLSTLLAVSTYLVPREQFGLIVPVIDLSDKNPLVTLPHDATIISLLEIFSRGTHRGKVPFRKLGWLC